MSQSVQIVERPVAEGATQTQRVLIPTVGMLEGKIRAVPRGVTRELSEICAELASEHGADATCEAATQRHMRVIAVIAHSAMTLRDPAVVPFWRVVDPNKPGSDRLAGGRKLIIAEQARERS